MPHLEYVENILGHENGHKFPQTNCIRGDSYFSVLLQPWTHKCGTKSTRGGPSLCVAALEISSVVHLLQICLS